MGNRVEPASSSRSKCVVCGAPIGKGEARLAEEYSDISIPKLIMRFYHVKCAAAAQPELLHHALRDVRPGTIFDRADIEARIGPAIERAHQQRIASYEAKRAVAIAVAPRVAGDATTLAVLAELEADPDNPELLAIVADQLMAQNDPRGELITVQLALAKASRRLPSRDRSSDPEDADDEADLEVRDAAEMTSQLARRFEELSTQLAVGPLDRGDRAVWGIGFVRRLELLNKTATRLAELAPLWAHPSMRIVAELKLSFSVVGDSAAMVELAHVVRPTLRKLELGHWSDAMLDHVQPLLDALPRLRSLELVGKLRSRIAHPAVESIKLARYSYRGELASALMAITGDGLPALRELAFEGHAPSESSRGPVREPVDDDTDAIVQQLVAQGVLARLERLTMAGGKLTERGIAALAGALGERKLARLDLSRLPMPRALRPRLAALCDELMFTEVPTQGAAADEWVEHANQPSWGRGKIVRRFDGKLEIAFPKAGTKIFKADARFLRFG